MLLSYLDFTPLLSPPTDLAESAAVIGRASCGSGLTLRALATLRADGEAIWVGADVFFGERATVHIEDNALAASVGNGVTVGRYAIVHACTVEDGVVVGDAAVVMDGAVVGANALITAGSLVPPRKQLPGGWIYAGHPVAPVRAIAAGELAIAAASLRSDAPHPLVRDLDVPPPDITPFLPPGASGGTLYARDGRAPRVARAYVAPTAIVVGDVTLADDAGIYFGCAIVAGDGRIVIGERSNVQDNSLLITDARSGELRIGVGVTIGHNVRMGAAIIGDDALIGMASQLGDGVVVEAQGCVAARALVEPRTAIRSGWIWAGRPARAFRELKPAEREAFASARDVYVNYGAAYRGRSLDDTATVGPA